MFVNTRKRNRYTLAFCGCFDDFGWTSKNLFNKSNLTQVSATK